MKIMLTISIIISVRNRIPYVENLLISLSENLPDNIETEIILVDDCSEDDMESIAQKYNTMYYRLEEHQGPA